MRTQIIIQLNNALNRQKVINVEFRRFRSMNLVVKISCILTLFSSPAFSQPKIECGGLSLLKNQKPHVTVNSIVQNDSVSKKALLNGLSLLLTDRSLKIIGFVAGYDCHSKNMIMDFHSRTFYGNTIKANDPFLKGVWKGDILTIECINVSGKGRKYIAGSRSFWVTD